MYNEHFGFIESPFNVTPDPAFSIQTVSIRKLSPAALGIKLRQGLIVSGGACTGKLV